MTWRMWLIHPQEDPDELGWEYEYDEDPTYEEDLPDDGSDDTFDEPCPF